jgi:acyl-CoA thioester hydrolase
MVVEAHVRYLRELGLEDPVRVTVQLLGYDTKRIHLFEELRHATKGWLSATSENMTLSVDMTAKKVAPFHYSVLRGLERLNKAHTALPRPEAAGRSIRMPRKS